MQIFHLPASSLLLNLPTVHNVSWISLYHQLKSAISFSIRSHYTSCKSTLSDHISQCYLQFTSFLANMFFSILVCHEPIGSECWDNAGTDSQQINKLKPNAVCWKNATRNWIVNFNQTFHLLQVEAFKYTLADNRCSDNVREKCFIAFRWRHSQLIRRDDVSQTSPVIDLN